MDRKTCINQEAAGKDVECRPYPFSTHAQKRKPVRLGAGRLLVFHLTPFLTHRILLV